MRAGSSVKWPASSASVGPALRSGSSVGTNRSSPHHSSRRVGSSVGAGDQLTEAGVQRQRDPAAGEAQLRDASVGLQVDQLRQQADGAAVGEVVGVAVLDDLGLTSDSCSASLRSFGCTIEATHQC